MRKIKRKYIRRVKGSVTIFLALLISPLLTVTLTLVEAARYQSTMETMKEVMDVSAFSTLADYNVFLEERFGVLAYNYDSSDTNKMNTQFRDFFDTNSKTVGKAVTVNSRSAKGCFPLSEGSQNYVLRQQLIEYSELTVATEMVYEGLNVEELIEVFKEEMNFDNITQQIKNLKETADVLDAMKDVVEAVKALGEVTIDTTTCGTNYEAFKTALYNYAVKKYTITKKEDGTYEVIVNELEESEENDLKTAVTNAKTNYQSSVQTLKGQLEDEKAKIQDLLDAIDNLNTQVEEKKACNPEGADQKLDNWTGELLNTINNTINSSAAGSIIPALDTTISAAQSLDGYLNSFNLDTFLTEEKLGSYTTITPELIGKLLTAGGIKALVVDAVYATITSTMQTLHQQLEAEADAAIGAELTQLTEMITMVQNIQGITDENLNSVVPAKYGSKANDSDKKILESMNSFQSAVEELQNASGIISVLKAAASAINGAVNFLEAIVEKFKELTKNIVSLVSKPTDIYEKMLLYGYGIYNMPNRVNYAEAESLTGYKFADSLGKEGDEKKLFKGAEAEYLVAGTNDEQGNQAAVYWDIYFLRLALNFKNIIFGNTEINTMVAPLGPWGIVAKIAILIVEPMLDTMVIVNGGNIKLIKDYCYLTPSGVNNLIEDIESTGKISNDLIDKAKEYANGNSSDKKESSDKDDKGKKRKLHAGYTGHLLIALVLYGDADVYLKRILNIIEMEAVNQNKNFNIKKSYTVMQNTVNYTMNPLFDVGGLTDKGLFKRKVTMKSGY